MRGEAPGSGLVSLGVVLVHKFSQNSYPPPLSEFCIDFSTLESLPMLSLCLGKAVGAEVKAILSPHREGGKAAGI